MTENYSNSN